jgi:ArsR family transcriptional regulator
MDLKDVQASGTEGATPGPIELMDNMRTASVEAAKLLRSIGSPYRLMILCYLIDGEKTVSEISDAIGARQSLTSQHLTHLRLHGLVRAERRGHFAYYSLADTVAKRIVAVLHDHFCEIVARRSS